MKTHQLSMRTGGLPFVIALGGILGAAIGFSAVRISVPCPAIGISRRLGAWRTQCMVRSSAVRS